MESWSTDAEFLYVGKSAAGSQVAVVCCNASSVVWEAHKLMSAKGRVLRCELSGDDPVNFVSSSPEAIVDNEAWKALMNVSRLQTLLG